MKLKSGITKEWLRKCADSEGRMTERDIWVDEHGLWHEIDRDGNEVTYARENAEVVMHDARKKESLPEEMRLCGFWLKLGGQWIAPLVCLGYRNNPASSQVVYGEETPRAAGGHIVYTETLILDSEKGARVHVVSTALDNELHRIAEESWSKWVEI